MKCRLFSLPKFQIFFYNSEQPIWLRYFWNYIFMDLVLVISLQPWNSCKAVPWKISHFSYLQTCLFPVSLLFMIFLCWLCAHRVACYRLASVILQLKRMDAHSKELQVYENLIKIRNSTYAAVFHSYGCAIHVVLLVMQPFSQCHSVQRLSKVSLCVLVEGMACSFRLQ